MPLVGGSSRYEEAHILSGELIRASSRRLLQVATKTLDSRAPTPQIQRNQPKMKRSPTFAVVLVTAPDLKTARRLAKAALEARLVACANLVPRVESHYRWRGKIETGTEVLMILKTSAARLVALEKLIVAKHPYDTPEFIVLPVSGGNRGDLKWVTECVRGELMPSS